MTRGMRKVRMGQQGTVITTLVALVSMYLQWDMARRLNVPLVIDGLNLIGVCTAAVSPLLFAMGANVAVHRALGPVASAQDGPGSRTG